jgi:hypothetical protein
MKKFSIGLLVLVTGCAYGSLDKLATALQKLELMVKLEPVKPGPNKSEDFLGPWMVQNRPQDLITSTDDFENTGIPVYQVEVLKQWEGDCWVHAFRNSLYFIDLLASPRNQFDTIYKNMVSHDQYEKFTKHGCPNQGTVTREFIKEQLSCRPECIPQNSLDYIQNVLTFKYEPEFSQDQLSKTKQILTSREGVTLSDKDIFDYTLIALPFNIQENNLPRLFEIMYNFQSKSSYTGGFSILSHYTSHETTLVINKNNGNFECLFSDSNNMSFKGDNRIVTKGNKTVYFGVDENEYDNITRSFRAQIKQVLHFIQDFEAFNNLAVRILYEKMQAYFYRQKKHNIDNQDYGLEGWRVSTTVFSVNFLETFYTNIKKYNLLNNKLYTSIYKKLYCDLIKKEQAAQPQNEHYITLLKKVEC